ncbi:MAG: pitrilysin family protein [Thomasclavelia sp.]|nr:pitrilysin family protein [Thomasclavelia sp.]
MDKKYYKTLKETLYHQKMDNGLEVYIMPKKGFNKSYGLFTTDFGSIDNTFIPLGEKDYIKVNDGIAHFLEHKMFDMKDGKDASSEFAKLGASSNAFTSTTRTAYLFSTVEHEKECVNLLLDFVQELNITHESVEKEKGIIKQEIKMYDDDPDWLSYFGSISNLYQKHPINKDIAGDCESVDAISLEELYKCYNTFYHPSNMVLFIVGNVDPTEIMNSVVANQNNKDFKDAKSIMKKKVIEPSEVAVARVEKKANVLMNKVITAIKINDIYTDPQKNLKRELSMNILLDCLFSKSSDLYDRLINEGKINSSFSANYTQTKDVAYIQLGGSQNDYSLLEKTIMNIIENIDDIEITEDNFKRIQKKNIGSFIEMFNSMESVANLFSRYYFEGINALDIVDEFVNISLEDINNCKKYFNSKLTSTYILKND